MKHNIRLLALTLSFIASPSLWAADYTWTGVTSNAWTTTTNWTPNTVPTLGTNFTADRLVVANAAGNGLIYNPGAGVTTTFGSERGLVLGQVSSAGSLTVISGTLAFGGTLSPAMNGTLLVNGGTIDFSANATNFVMGFASPSVNTITLSSGSLIANVIELNNNSTGTSTINLDGGTFGSKGFVRTSTANTTTVNFNGGMLQARAASATFLAPSVGLSAIVKSGGARIDTNTFGITISAALIHDSALGATVDGGLTKSGAGALSLTGANTYTGDTTVNAGTLNLSRSAGFGGNSGSISTGALTINTGGTATTTVSFGISGDTSATNNRVVNISGGTLNLGFSEYVKTYNLTGGTLNAPTVANEFLRAATSGLVINSLASATTSTVNNKVDLTFNSLIVDAANGAAAVDITIAGVISENQGAGSGGKTLTKNGEGTLALTGANSYTGGTTVNAGTLNLSRSAGFGGNSGSISTGALTINTGGTATATVSFGISGDTSAANNRVVNLSGGTFNLGFSEYVKTYNLTGGTLNAPTVANEFLRSPATGLFINSLAAATSSTIANKVDLTFGSLTVDTADGAAAVDLNITAVISQNTGAGSGAKSLLKTGTGTLALSGTNSYTGTTSVNAGTLQVDANNALGSASSGTSVASGATLRLNNVNYSTAEALSLNGSNALTNTGTSTYAGQITAATNAGINAGGGVLNLTGGLVKNGTTLTLTGGGRINISGTGISGASANSDLIVDGTTVVFSANSNFNGPTTLQNNGTLVANATVQSTTMTVDAGSTLSGTGRVEAASNGYVYLNGTLQVGNSTLGAPVPSLFELATSGTGSTVLGLGSQLMFDLFSNVGDNTSILSASDRIKLFGQLDPALGGTLVIGNPNSLSSFAVGDKWRLFDWAALSTISSDLAVDYSSLSLGPTLSGSFDRSSGIFSLNAVPEPSRALLVMLGVAGVLLRRRRVFPGFSPPNLG
ncbi:MAG: autotransporter-associated beta strand repeat-containing protein [Verrucomicrobia bacterium]|nr:autotransporter-associated beta strand repeat-containing protein [Verrucomicrobiota bacterium]